MKMSVVLDLSSQVWAAAEKCTNRPGSTGVEKCCLCAAGIGLGAWLGPLADYC